MRNDHQFQQVLDAAHHAAAEHARQQGRLTEAMIERYGVTHSDVDADGLIDALDYGGSSRVKVAECDAEMASHGHPKLTR